MNWINIEQGQSGLVVAEKLNAALSYLINPPVQDVVNSNYVMNGEVDKIILVSTGNQDRIITLPPLSGSGYEDNLYIIIKIDDGTGKVIINGYEDDQIMGQDFVFLSYQWEIYKLQKHQALWIPNY